jgi:hypothetical protein
MACRLGPHTAAQWDRTEEGEELWSGGKGTGQQAVSSQFKGLQWALGHGLSLRQPERGSGPSGSQRRYWSIY